MEGKLRLPTFHYSLYLYARIAVWICQKSSTQLKMIENQTLQILKLLTISLQITSFDLILEIWWIWFNSPLPSYPLRVHNYISFLIFRQSANFQEVYFGFIYKIFNFKRFNDQNLFCSRISQKMHYEIWKLNKTKIIWCILDPPS